jgi:LysR family transcriptional regulator, glycine cleavage system transcriptional activator
MIPRNVSLDALRVFECAARHLSFTRAAAELSLTQGAVSQRIQALESRLGVTLFRRRIRALELSPQGAALHAGVHDALARIQAALAALQPGGGIGLLRLTVAPSLATRWLMPRCGELARLDPPVALSVLADDRLADIGIDADAGLRFGSGRYLGLTSVRVGDEELFPVCSPAYLADHPEALELAALKPGAWRGLMRLVDTVADEDGSGCGWRAWGERAQVRWDERAPSTAFSHAYLALQAAAEGQGIALARRVLAADDLTQGRLVRIARRMPAVPARFHYHFVTKGEPDARGRALVPWLQAALAATRVHGGAAAIP